MICSPRLRTGQRPVDASTARRTAPLPDAYSALPSPRHPVGCRQRAGCRSYGYDPFLPEQPDKLAILHQRKEKREYQELDPKIYNDTAWYAGAVLLIGDLVEIGVPE